MAKKELKLMPCPFCGSAAELKALDDNDGYKVVCSDLHCIASTMYRWLKTEEDAIKIWERRAES